MKKDDKKRILIRVLAKEITEEKLKQVAGGSVSHCGNGEYDDTDQVF